MSLEASTETPHSDAEGQFSLPLEPVSTEPIPSDAEPNTLDNLTINLVNPSAPRFDSLWVSMSNGEQLHLRHFLPNNLSSSTKPVERVFMLHGEAECGRIFYDNSGQGLAGYLVSLGYEVFVADLGARGRSLGSDGRVSELTTRQIITEAIPRFLRTIELHNNDTASQDSVHLISNKATIWVAHGFGGVLLSAAWARLSETQRSASRMIFFGSRRKLQSSDRWARQFARIFSHPLVSKLINWYQVFPAKLLKLGSSDENPDWYHCYAKWMSQDQWLDPEDNFDYKKALKAQPVPPTLHFAAEADAVFAHVDDVRAFVDELGPHDARLMVLGDITESDKQYDHLSMLIHPSAKIDVFSILDQWLIEQVATMPNAQKTITDTNTYDGGFMSHDKVDLDAELATKCPLETETPSNIDPLQEQSSIVLCA